MMTAECVKTYALRIDPRTGEVMGETANVGAGAELSSMVRAYQAEHGDMGFTEALNRLVAANEKASRLLRDYNGKATRPASPKSAGVDVALDTLVRHRMQTTGEASYSAACRAVLAENPILGRQWAGGRR